LTEYIKDVISDVKDVAKFKVEIERPLCIACETCVNTCPEFWEMADDGFSHLKGSKRTGENEGDGRCEVQHRSG
jgi:ferredoxin